MSEKKSPRPAPRRAPAAPAFTLTTGWAALVLALWLALDVEVAVAKKKDYYALLGVKKNADDATLKKAQILKSTPYGGIHLVVVCNRPLTFPDFPFFFI